MLNKDTNIQEKSGHEKKSTFDVNFTSRRSSSNKYALNINTFEIIYLPFSGMCNNSILALLPNTILIHFKVTHKDTGFIF